MTSPLGTSNADSAAAAPTEPLRYVPPVRGYLLDWAGSQTDHYRPTPRQQLVIDAVTEALKAGHRYHHDLVQFCQAQLQVLDAEAHIVDALGMDCYNARGYLDARRYFELERDAWSRLHLQPGEILGTLVFSDCKRTTCTTVTRLETETRYLHMVGRRGRLQVEMRTNALQLAHAMDRAKERHLRATSFDEFTALGVVKALASTAPAARGRAHVPTAAQRN